MVRNVLNTLSLISGCLAVCVVVLWIWTLDLDPQINSISLCDTFHVTTYRGRVHFFNVKEIGPYQGSILRISDEHPLSERYGFGDAYGIYYRYFRWAKSDWTLWTLSVSLAYPLIVFTVLPAGWLCRRWWAKRTARCDKPSTTGSSSLFEP